jgi:hypothetical protein
MLNQPEPTIEQTAWATMVVGKFSPHIRSPLSAWIVTHRLAQCLAEREAHPLPLEDPSIGV